MTIPDYQSLMLPVLKIGAAQETAASAAVAALADEFRLTEAERSEQMPSGRGSETRFANRVHWAITYLVHAKLMIRPRRGFFVATSAGREMLARNPAKIDNRVLAKIPEFAAWTGRSRTKPSEQQDQAPSGDAAMRTAPLPLSDTRTPHERMESDFQELDATLRDALLQRVTGISPAAFEYLIVDLLVSMGYDGGRKGAVKAIGQSGDGGVDGVINQDELGLDVVYVQAKRYQPEIAIGRPALQAFVGSLDGLTAGKGIFVTTSRFSKDALEYVKRTSKRVILIDGNQLTQLMVQHNEGVRTHVVYQLKGLDEDYFDPDSQIGV